MKQRIFITGGSGFTGSHIVRELVASGMEVACLVRERSSSGNLDGLPLTVVRGDITDGWRLEAMLAGYHAVVHNAALVNDWSGREEFFRVNVEGTMAIMDACRIARIPQVVMTGTISSYGEAHCLKVKDETWRDHSHHPYLFDRWFPCRMNHYRDTKAQATRMAAVFAREHRMNLTILEPAFVYGEREFSTGFYEYVKSARQGIPAAPGSRRNRFPVIYAGDLARAYRAALRKKLPGVHRIIVANPSNERMDRILALYCRCAGVRKPVRLPKWTVYLPATALELLYTLLRCRHPPVITRGRVDMFIDNVEFSAEKAKRLLGFVATTPLEEGIRRTVEWYKENGFL
ncbi:MAG: NAD-dependent epimerase/dehydratase family protein [Chitinispirillaceae bacterium]|nr:NAD-dependent epimerase/dehydratase family protein [Chitinispirillaceae bacterium]